MNDYQQYIHKSRYARWNDELGRRETWTETVDRYMNFFYDKQPALHSKISGELSRAIRTMEVMPSMRCLMTAGEALERDRESEDAAGNPGVSG